MTKEYFYFPSPNRPRKRLCDRCTVYELCEREYKEPDNIKLFEDYD